jgi:heme-degrading monooxygenase HmoA
VIHEVAVLNVRPGEATAFERSFREAQALIARTDGYLGHQLLKCCETENRYLLHVRWRSIEDHTHGFRGGPDYAKWSELLHHFYDPFPVVDHYEPVFDSNS